MSKPTRVEIAQARLTEAQRKRELAEQAEQRSQKLLEDLLKKGEPEPCAMTFTQNYRCQNVVKYEIKAPSLIGSEAYDKQTSCAQHLQRLTSEMLKKNGNQEVSVKFWANE